MLALSRRERLHAGDPAVVLGADAVGLRHAHVVEEDLAELGLAGDLPQRLHGHAGRLHVHDHGRDALVAGRIGIGAREEPDVVGDQRVRGPDLLAGDDVVVAVAHGAGLQRRQIGAGVGFGEALAPDLLGSEHRLQVPPLLVLAADGDQRRAGDHQADVVDAGRRLRAGGLLVVDRLLPKSQALAPVFGRPGQSQPPGLVQLSLPRLEAVDVVLVHADRVVLEPRAGSCPECGFAGRILESCHATCSLYRGARASRSRGILRCRLRASARSARLVKSCQHKKRLAVLQSLRVQCYESRTFNRRPGCMGASGRPFR